ncbi:hypothetical protein C8R45DRAFT_1023954 [Mycena sanguinolenta]|nr:hypothetical protein C8R45DRAFT_1023954 [Mycena sanguinolenta]
MREFRLADRETETLEILRRNMPKHEIRSKKQKIAGLHFSQNQRFLRNQGWAPNRILATTKKLDGWSPLPIPNRPRDFSKASAPYIYGERRNCQIRRTQQQSAKIALKQLSRIETACDVRKRPLRAKKRAQRIAGRCIPVNRGGSSKLNERFRQGCL